MILAENLMRKCSVHGVGRLIVDQTNHSVSPTKKGKGFLLTPTGPYGLRRTVAATRVRGSDSNKVRF